MRFEEVLPRLKKGAILKRSYWKDVFIQLHHDPDGLLTEECIVMTRRDKVFVTDLSTESILATDWEIVKSEEEL